MVDPQPGDRLPDPTRVEGGEEPSTADAPARWSGAAAVPDQVAAVVTGPGEKGLVDSHDGAVGKHRQIPARRMLVQVVRVLIPGQPQLLCHVDPT